MSKHLQCLLRDDVGIGLDLAGHHHLAQPERALDDHPILRAVARVGGERDAGLLGVDHLLDDHRHRRVGREVAAGPVGDDSRGKQRHPAPKHRVEERLLAADVGDGRVHPGERCIAAVFAGRRGSHGDNGVRSEGAIRGKKRIAHRVGNAGLVNEALQPLTALGQMGCVGDVGQCLAMKRVQFGVHAARAHRVPVAVPQQDEAGRNGQLGRDQLTHVRALPAGFLGIGNSQRRDIADVSVGLHVVHPVPWCAAGIAPDDHSLRAEGNEHLG